MIGNIDSLGKIPELRKRILFTLVLLFVYRIGIFIPTPGVNTQAMLDFFAKAQGTLFGLFNTFSGGAVSRFSVTALGVMPYISAAIILEVLTVVVPQLEQLKKEGDMGRKKITQYTRYLTVGLAFFQGIGIAYGLEGMRGPAGEMIVLFPGWTFRIFTAVILTAGTTFLMWLGEQITERGIGNGISLLIYAGIVVRLPGAIGKMFQMMSIGELTIFIALIIIVVAALTVWFIVFMETAQRRLPVQYARRVVGRKVYGGSSTHLPLKVNIAGVIPPIFASSLLMFPLTIANFSNSRIAESVKYYFSPGTIWYVLTYVGLIIFFAYFYTAIQFNPVDVADNLKKWGGYIPGIRPGDQTASYIDRILTRITLIGGLYVALVCVLPTILISELNTPFYFGGTSLLIAVGVALDTMQQLQAHLVSRYYDGFLGGSGNKLKGRKG